MRNLFIITALALSLFSNAQKMSKEFLEGKWESQTVEIIFSGTNKQDFKIESFSTLTGYDFEILSYQFNKGSFYLKTLYNPNDWEALAKFVIIDDNTMVADYVCDAPDTIIYKRVLNN